MASTLNGKRMFLTALAIIGLAAAAICAGLMVAGVVAATRERLFLVGSLIVVSIVCLVLSFVFKGQAMQLQDQIEEAQYQRVQRESEDPDDVQLPQNRIS